MPTCQALTALELLIAVLTLIGGVFGPVAMLTPHSTASGPHRYRHQPAPHPTHRDTDPAQHRIRTPPIPTPASTASDPPRYRPRTAPQ
ncbi:hypothetical protein AB0L58_29920, partial [Nocardia sp. NPDC052112]